MKKRAINILINCLLQNKMMTRISHKAIKKWNKNSVNMRGLRI